MLLPDGTWTFRYDKALRTNRLPRPDAGDAWAMLPKIKAPTLLIRGELRGQRWVYCDDQVATCSSGKDGRLNRSQSRHFRRRVPDERHPIDVVAIEVGK